MSVPVLRKCKCGFERLMKKLPRDHCRKCRPIKGGQPRKVVRVKVENKTVEITTKHPLYMRFHHIKERCYNPSANDKPYYKNIKVCEEWLRNPALFYRWAFYNGWKRELVIDRIDSDKDYSPNNCQFISATENTKKAHLRRRPHTMSSQEIKIRKLLKSSSLKLKAIAVYLKLPYNRVLYVNTKINKEILMPVAPRSNDKAKKIAYDILGTPANMEKKKKTKKQKKTKKRLLLEETALSR